MKREHNFFYLVALTLICMIPSFANAQQWSGIIDPSRAVNWANAGVPGGVPPRTTICSTLSAGASVSSINSAIAACPAGQTVMLNAGSYNLSGGIIFNNKSNVTEIRGSATSSDTVRPGSCSSRTSRGARTASKL